MKNRHAIYHDLIIEAPINNVFNAISNAEELTKWWPLRCEGDPNLNTTYNFYFSNEYNWFGVVSSIKNNEHFHIKMTEADTDWNSTTFGFDLKEDNNRTHVSFFHKNWPECNQHFKRSSFCWAVLLQGLKNYLEKGVVIPFEQRA